MESFYCKYITKIFKIVDNSIALKFFKLHIHLMNLTEKKSVHILSCFFSPQLYTKEKTALHSIQYKTLFI